MAPSSAPSGDRQSIPFYRDVKVLAILAQVVFAVLVALLFWYLYSNMMDGLRHSSIPTGFDFLRLTAGFAVTESAIAFQPTDTYGRAFLVGIVNTLRVSVIGIIVATILGILIGISRLSSNWLLRTLASTYVEIIRNVPLLVQLIFWYQAVILKLPRVREAIGLEGVAYVSNRGLAVAWPVANDSFAAWQPWLWAGLVAGIAAYAWRRRSLARADRPGSAIPQALLAAGVPPLLGMLVVSAQAGAFPLVIDTPELAGFNIAGGVTLSPEFFALLIGLSIYTAAFIAEVVRGGVQSVNKGQREAARSLGLSAAQTMRLVIFPQALRIIVPPMTNQYLNLTKNSSLGIAVAYADLFNISTTIQNQSGRTLSVIILLMGAYLSVSLVTSLLMNIYNARIRLVER